MNQKFNLKEKIDLKSKLYESMDAITEFYNISRDNPGIVDDKWFRDFENMINKLRKLINLKEINFEKKYCNVFQIFDKSMDKASHIYFLLEREIKRGI